MSKMYFGRLSEDKKLIEKISYHIHNFNAADHWFSFKEASELKATEILQSIEMYLMSKEEDNNGL